MLDDKADKAMEEVLQRGAALVEALDLTPVEREYAMKDAQEISRRRRGFQSDVLRQVGDGDDEEVPRSGEVNWRRS